MELVNRNWLLGYINLMTSYKQYGVGIKLLWRRFNSMCLVQSYLPGCAITPPARPIKAPTVLVRKMKVRPTALTLPLDLGSRDVVPETTISAKKLNV